MTSRRRPLASPECFRKPCVSDNLQRIAMVPSAFGAVIVLRVRLPSTYSKKVSLNTKVNVSIVRKLEVPAKIRTRSSWMRCAKATSVLYWYWLIEVKCEPSPGPWKKFSTLTRAVLLADWSHVTVLNTTWKNSSSLNLGYICRIHTQDNQCIK